MEVEVDSDDVVVDEDIRLEGEGDLTRVEIKGEFGKEVGERLDEAN